MYEYVVVDRLDLYSTRRIDAMYIDNFALRHVDTGL